MPAGGCKALKAVWWSLRKDIKTSFRDLCHNENVLSTDPIRVTYIFTKPAVGVTKPISSVALFPPFFLDGSNTYWISHAYLTDVAAVTPVKYECDSKTLKASFIRSKIYQTEKFTDGALVTPIQAHPTDQHSGTKIEVLEELCEEDVGLYHPVTVCLFYLTQ